MCLTLALRCALYVCDGMQKRRSYQVPRHRRRSVQGTGDAVSKGGGDTSSELMRPKGDRHASGCALHATSRRGATRSCRDLSLKLVRSVDLRVQGHHKFQCGSPQIPGRTKWVPQCNATPRSRLSSQDVCGTPRTSPRTNPTESIWDLARTRQDAQDAPGRRPGQNGSLQSAVGCHRMPFSLKNFCRAAPEYSPPRSLRMAFTWKPAWVSSRLTVSLRTVAASSFVLIGLMTA